jgi:hypothetical protein
MEADMPGETITFIAISGAHAVLSSRYTEAFPLRHPDSTKYRFTNPL